MLRHGLSRFDLIHRFSNRVMGETYAGVRTFLLPSGIRSDSFHPDFEGRGDDRTARFYFMARLVPCKGLRVLLEAWRIALERGLGATSLCAYPHGGRRALRHALRNLVIGVSTVGMPLPLPARYLRADLAAKKPILRS